MFKKVTLIIFLSILLAGILVVRHFWLRTTTDPTMVERMPEGDFLVRAKVLDLAHETSGMLHFNKVSFRDFASKEFLLGQAKSYGLDLQRPVYAFVNENGSWGVLIHVADSSEIGGGIQRLARVVNFEDTVVSGQTVIHWKDEDGYLTYGKNWLFIYKGEAFAYNLNHILNAKQGVMNEKWDDFLKQKHYSEKSLVIYSNSPAMPKYGLEKAMFAHNVDSTRITLLSYVKSVKPFSFVPKKEGLAMEMKPSSDKFLNLHMNIDGFKNNPEDPVYKLMAQQSKKISFPLHQFLNTWQGDFSFREGGTQIVKETFIESVMDENFEVSEVVSEKERKVKGFSLSLSMNENATNFIAILLKKGILTEDAGKYRFLISPPLNMKKQGNYYSFYSGTEAPVLKPSAANNGFLSYRRTPFTFYLDTVIKNEAFGQIEFPVKRVLQRSKFF